MSAASRSPQPLDWGDLAALGEQLVSATSLSSQRDQIHAMVSTLIKGKTAVWLQENLFRLPDSNSELNFTQGPPSSGMERAMKAGKLRTKRKSNAKTNGSRDTWACAGRDYFFHIRIELEGLLCGDAFQR